MDTGRIKYYENSFMKPFPLLSEKSNGDIIGSNKEKSGKKHSNYSVEKKLVCHPKITFVERCWKEIKETEPMSQSCHSHHNPHSSSHCQNFSEEKNIRKEIRKWTHYHYNNKKCPCNSPKIPIFHLYSKNRICISSIKNHWEEKTSIYHTVIPPPKNTIRKRSFNYAIHPIYNI